MRAETRPSASFRNIAAHQYGRIDFEDVYKTVTEDIPALKEALLRPH